MDTNALRILDANFNRAREALRVVEEYCRFVLDSKELTARSKSLRHQLCRVLGRIDSVSLIGSRDSLSDVGRGLQVNHQLKRTSLKDCFTAACKRLTEALRALAEVGQTIDPEATAQLEKLRFEAYSLEKDVVFFACTNARFRDARLYVLLTVTPEDSDQEVLALAKDCIAGGADCIQLRAKGLEDCRILSVARQLVAECRAGGVLSIINDRADIAVASAADGVHLGRSDLPASAVRKIQNRPMIIGLTTHDLAELAAAIAQRPTYVALGPVFPTVTKPDLSISGLEYVSKALELLKAGGIPHVAIGGITLENLGLVLDAGVRTVAVCSAVTGSAKPGEMCEKIKLKILEKG